ncbi:MAG TPA: Gfo/Idh/MocA family oxidoreductase [Paenibacillus sp.]|nr:Gfo/Idh/MocA family oxidoreductase [Paenibacillus sp.]
MSLKNIGLIGLDTSHVIVFTQILNDAAHELYIDAPARVTSGYPGGSPDFPLSIDRVEGFTKRLEETYGVRIAGSPEEVAEHSDALFITSVDGRVHLEQFRAVAPYGKPVFIDKPLALRGEEAKEIFAIAQQYGIPCMSSSTRRFARALVEELGHPEKGPILGAEVYGIIDFMPTQTGWFWYGIHNVEVLYAILGTGCVSVTAYSQGKHEVIVGVWSDGRVGIVRGNPHPNGGNGALIHRENETAYVDTAPSGMANYAELVKQALHMFETGISPVPAEETIEIIHFIEAANESRATGKPILLK